MTPSGRITVLLVEDDEDSRSLLAELLGDQFDVLTARDAPEGLRAFEHSRPDVVITDESLPGMRGTALAKELKQRWPTSRVVLVSGFARPEGTEYCDVVLKKPFDLKRLYQVLHGLLESAPEAPLW